MNKFAYLECPTGIAGDMCLGALVNIGVPLEYLIEKLKGLGLEEEYSLKEEKVYRGNQLATKVHVDLRFESTGDRHPPARTLPEIEKIIKNASLPAKAAAWSLKVFRQLAVAEGAVHGVEPEKVHFHEVGATDAIVDIVGTCSGLDWLGIEDLQCSPLPVGGGTVKAAHGTLPVPVPAVLKLWESRQVPVYSNGIEMELVTPTGAAIATTLASRFGALPPIKIERIGLGAGSRELPIPNILRLWLGDREASLSSVSETIVVLETQIDDSSPQAIAYAFETLFEVGALDVFTREIGMKKTRSGTLLTVICLPEKVEACEAVIFRETTTLGIRRSLQQRSILNREIEEVATIYGKVRVKVATKGDKEPKTIANVQPEYEDCARLARQHDRPWQEIHRIARDAWYRENAARSRLF